MNRYYPGVIQQPGPAAHVYPDENAVAGVICHSAEGRWSDVYGPLDTMTQRGVSWHFSVYQDGRIEQHYPITASCWHAGNARANRRLIGIEHEGITGEPLTAPQLAASVALVRWIAQQAGWDGLQRDGNLFEHREFSSTTCPNGRIPWERYEEADGMEPTKVEGTDAPMIRAFMESAGALNREQGEFLSVDEGPRKITVNVPAGYRFVGAMVKE